MNWKDIVLGIVVAGIIVVVSKYVLRKFRRKNLPRVNTFTAGLTTAEDVLKTPLPTEDEAQKEIESLEEDDVEDEESKESEEQVQAEDKKHETIPQQAEPELISLLRPDSILQSKNEVRRNQVRQVFKYLSSFPLFHYMESNILWKLSKLFTFETVPAGKVLFGRKNKRQTETVPCDSLYIVIRGTVKVFINNSKVKKSEYSQQVLTRVKDGHPINCSLLFLEALISNEETKVSIEDPENNDIISAVTEEVTTLARIRLNSTAFAHYKKYVKSENSRYLNNLCFSFALRLERVFLSTVHRYFGIAQHLITNHNFIEQDASGDHLALACAGFSKYLSIPASALEQHIIVSSHPPGTLLMTTEFPDEESEEVEVTETGMLIVIRGQVGVYISTSNDSSVDTEYNLLQVAPVGEIIGELIIFEGDLHYNFVTMEGKRNDNDESDDSDHEATPEKIGANDGLTVVGKLPKSAIDRLAQEYPHFLERVIMNNVKRSSPLMKQIDFALEWMNLVAGDVLYKENESSDSMFVVISGRLRALKGNTRETLETERENDVFSSLQNNHGQRVVAEYSKGESLGALEVLMSTYRSSTVVAVRDSEIVKISASTFHRIVHLHPHVLVRFSSIVGKEMRSKGSNKASIPGSIPTWDDLSANYFDNGFSAQTLQLDTEKLTTCALLAVEENVPLSWFAQRLSEEVGQIMPSIRLDPSSAPPDFINDRRQARLLRWLNELEEHYRFVIYECDNKLTSWTQRCLRQADCILIVGWVHGNYELSEIEKYMLQHNKQTSARKELVLIHHQGSGISGTINWLSIRKGWLCACHHVTMKKQQSKHPKQEPTFTAKLMETGKQIGRQIVRKGQNVGTQFREQLLDRKLRSFKDSVSLFSRDILSRFRQQDNNGLSSAEKTKNSNEKQQNQDPKDEIYSRLFTPNPRDDIARIARRITGTSVGLVLGGGGARGFAHIGVIRALEENGIPIDLVGGTSMGSFIGALYSREPWDYFRVMAWAKRFSSAMQSPWAKIRDLTLPYCSFFTGEAFNKELAKLFGDETQIEDLSLPYFAVTTDISHSNIGVHRNGTLWKYVRASMSLAGFFPPLCDVDGSLLVDGGYVNNLPADVMRKLGCKTIIAVDVGAEDDTNYYNYGESLTGLEVFVNRWFQKGTKKFPYQSDVQSHLAFVSCVQLLEKVKKQKDCIYMRPPVTSFATLEFGKFNTIVETGYNYAKEQITSWKLKAPIRTPRLGRSASYDALLDVPRLKA